MQQITDKNFKYLWFLTLSYVMVLAFANWFDPRLVNVFGLVTDAGTLIFPISFILSDIITEVYGYKHARRAIWTGFLFNVIFITYGQIVTNLPSPAYPTQNAMFDALLTANSRIIIASVISYFIAEPLNSFIIAKLKIKMHGKAMSVRFALSTIIASGCDSCVFGFIAFYNVISNTALISLILTMWLIKVAIEILGLPLSTYCTKKIKLYECTDVYDYRTNFSLLSLDSAYKTSANKFVG